MAQGIVFQHNLEEAIVQAKKENKMIFVDFYTSWCAPCKMMAADIFPQKEVGDFYNSKFVNVKIQCDDKGYGVALGKKYNVAAYPTLMYLDSEGKTVHSIAGGLDSRGFIELGKTAIDPNKNQLTMIKAYDAGNRDQVFLEKYFTTLIRAYRGDKATYDFEQYFESLDKAQKASANTYQLMLTLRSAPFTPVFEYMEKNKKDYYRTIGKVKIDSVIAERYLWYLKNLQSSAIYNNNRTEFDAKLKAFKVKGYSYYKEYAAFLQVFDCKDSEGKDDINLYMQRGTDFLKQYGKNRDAYTISLAHLLGNYSSASSKGLAGIQWMEELLERNRKPQYLSTYFYILWRNEFWDKALEVGHEIKANQQKVNQSTEAIDKQIQMVSDLKSKSSKEHS